LHGTASFTLEYTSSRAERFTLVHVRLPDLEEGLRLKGLGATRPRPVTAHLPAMTWLSTQLANAGTVSRMSTPIDPTA
jgi:hypothetical protein